MLPTRSPVPMDTHAGNTRWSRASPTGAAREAEAGLSWPYMAIFAPLLQLPAAPHPKAGSGADSQSLACLFPVNLFPAERPPRGLCTMGMVVFCPDTITRTKQGGSANPIVVTEWVQPLSALGSDPPGPQQHPQIQGALQGSLHPCTRVLHIQRCWRGRGTEDAENVGTVMGTRARSHRNGGRGATLSCHPSSLGTQAKAQHCTKSSEQLLKPHLRSWGTKAEDQHCKGTCQPSHAAGTISQPCKPKSYSSLSRIQMHLKCKMSSSPPRRGVGGIHDNRSDPICSQLPAWHLLHSPTCKHNSYTAKGKQISAAFKRLVMVISPIAKARQDHVPGRYMR